MISRFRASFSKDWMGNAGKSVTLWASRQNGLLIVEYALCTTLADHPDTQSIVQTTRRCPKCEAKVAAPWQTAYSLLMSTPNSVIQLKVVNVVEDFDFETGAKMVEGLFLKLNTRKQIGPDNICGRLLKLCTSQLSVVFSQLFTWSLKGNTIPFTWKTFAICPVPKLIKTKSFLFKRLLSDCSDISDNSWNTPI